MSETPDFTINQMNIFCSYFHGMIFALNILLLIEIPMIILEGNLFVQLSTILIIIPFLTFFNVIMFINLKAIWMKENKLRISKRNGGKSE